MNLIEQLFAPARNGRTQRLWRLSVQDAQPITPLVRRLTFTAPDLGDMTWRRGQDLVLNLPEAPRRHYTIRSLEGGRLSIDFVLHGHGAAAAWAKNARAGERVDALGPRGRTSLADNADWHLFVGDETCIPAIFAMIEALPLGAPAFAFLEIESEAEKQDVATGADLQLEWVVRGGPAHPNELLLNRLKAFDPPPGQGHAYVIGETSGVRAQRRLLLDKGWPREQITAEGYWRPGRIGGHDHV
ncbi:MAG TPA: siderophore-interacting protein [Caulobacteraceae bacterium]|jgi:NADPH-dependent ferric siderophore reductase|nr:siderophore-interacting protein [Caulobacteraceae bacterium]